MSKTYRIDLDHQQQLVRVFYQGAIDLATAAAMTTDARELANQHGYQLLYDLRNARLAASLTAVGEFPANYVSMVTASYPDLASANLISPDDNLDYWQFYGRACQTAGVVWQAFFTEEEALQWLHQQRQK